MKNWFYLAAQYIRFYKTRSFLLLTCLSIITCLPIGLRTLISHYQNELENRAQSTPLILGVRGHRFDLAMSALYFRTSLERCTTMEELDKLNKTNLATTYPMYVRHTSNNFPIVGTTIDYFEFRNLKPSSGTLPMLLGDVVLGDRVAERLGVGAGDHIISDQTNLYNLASQYPLKMNVVGVLQPNGTADDDAVFTDLKTTWTIEGLAHGHDDPTAKEQQRNILSRDKNNVVANANLTSYIEITPENIAGFHFHGNEADLPLTSVICVPKDLKSATIIKARYKLSKTVQLLSPASVISELLLLVFKVELFLHSSFLLVGAATAALLGLIVMLSIRLRKDEFSMLHAIGCSRKTVAGMISVEWIMIALASLLVSTAIIMLTLYAAPNISRLM